MPALTPETRTRKPESQLFTLTLKGQTMRVTFTPYRFANYGHLEFSSPDQLPRRILVSETGYRSHFAPMHEIEEAPNVEAYAQALAIALMDATAHDENQGDLFD